MIKATRSVLAAIELRRSFIANSTEGFARPRHSLRLLRAGLVLATSLFATTAMADIVSVPFQEGFIGTYGSSNRVALNVRTFAALGIEASLVQQNSSTTVFEAPTGNDIPVDLVLIQGGTTYTIPGSISWKIKSGSVLEVFGFTPDATQSSFQTYSVPIPGGGTYTLDSTSNYGVVKTDTSLAALGIVDGQAKVSGSNDPVDLGELNDYLALVRGLRPYGPITVNTQTVFATNQGGSYVAQPTLTGEACILTASTDSNIGVERIDVVVNGVSYTNVSYTVQPDGVVGTTTCDIDGSDGLTIQAVTWSLDLSAQSPAQSVPPGTYDISATLLTVSPVYNSLTDSTSAELTVVQEAPELTVTKTATMDKTVAGGTSSVDVGDVISYQISVENTGNVDISTPSSIVDAITAANASSLTPAYQSGDTNTDSMISVGETWVYTASYTLVSGDLDTGQVENIVTFQATSAGGSALTVQSSPTGNTTSTGSPTITTFDALSALTIKKTATLNTEVVGGTDDTSVDVGDQVTYKVTVTNTGNTVLENLVIADTLSRVDAGDTATQITSTSVDAAMLGTPTDNDSGTSGATMNPNEIWVYTYVHTLTQADIDAGRLSNTASATDGTLYVDSTVGGNTDSSTLTEPAPDGTPTVTTLTQGPQLKVKKTADLAVSGATYLTGNNAAIVDQDDDGVLSAGDRVYFTITAENTGNVTLTNVTISDTLTTAEATPSALSLTSGPTLTADTGTTGDTTLEVGDVWTYAAYYALTQTDIDLGVGIKNLAEFTATPPSGTPFTVGSTVGGNVASGAEVPTTVDLEGTAAITGVKTVAITTDTGETGLTVGDTLTYTITATNAGNVTLTGVGIASETLSRGTAGNLTTVTGFDATDFATSDSTTLAPGELAVFTATYVVTQDDIDAGGLSNTATVTGTPPTGDDVTDVTDDGDDTDGNTSDDPTTSTVPAAPAITGVKTVAITTDTGDAGLTVGDTLTYTITATNAGNVTLTGVGIASETLSRGTAGNLETVTGFDATDFATSDSTTLAPGASAVFTATYVVTQDDIDAGGLSNTATVTGTPPTGDDVTDETDDDTAGADNDPTTSPVTAAPAITGVKTVAITTDTGETGISVGDTLTYTITATNAGNVTLSDVGIASETLSRGTAGNLETVTGFDATDFATSDSTTLAPGASAVFTATYVVTQDDIDAGGLSNTATVTGTPPTGDDVTDVTDDDTAGADNDPTISEITTSPAIHIQKVVDDSALDDGVRPGDTLDYTITITNIGDVTLSNVMLTDILTDLNAGPLTLDAAPSKTSDSGATTNDTVLEVGDVWVFEASYTLTADAIATGGVENIARVTAQTPTGGTVNAESKVAGNASYDGDGQPTATGFAGEISGTVREYQVGAPSIIVYLLRETSPGVYDYVDDPDAPGTRWQVVTDENGDYSFIGLEPGTYGVEFVNNATSSTPNAESDDGVETGNRILDIEVNAGAVKLDEDAFLIDPSGIVYDAETFEALQGAVVTLYYQSSEGATPTAIPNSWLDLEHGDPNGMTTEADGEYTFYLDPTTAQNGIYSLTVEAPNYRFESQSIPALAGPFNPGVGGNVLPITDETETSPGMDTTYYLSFQMVFTSQASTSSNGVVYNNIPLDPVPELMPEIEEDLTQILRDDLAATMTQQSRQMSGYAADALTRLKSRSGPACADDIAQVLAANPIRFATASARILEESAQTLDQIAALLQSCPGAVFQVAGHTDDRADADYNLALSQARAAAVVAALQTRGVDFAQLSPTGFGETRPIADNATEAGRQLNRRVEFIQLEAQAGDAPCELSEETQRALDLHADGDGVTVNGNFKRETRDCEIDGWRIFSGTASYLKNDQGISQGMFTLNYRVERFASNDRVSGWFVGLYGSDDTITGLADGSIKGIGLNGGLYGAMRLQDKLFADYYLGAAAGRHTFSLDFDRAGKVTLAEGHYDYYALFAGAALSGEVNLNGLTLTPRVGFDAAWSPGGEAEVTASRDGFEEFGLLSTGEVSGLRVYAELGFDDLLLDDPATLSFTPRLFCDRPIGDAEDYCSVGAKLDYSRQDEATGKSFGVELDVEGGNGQTYGAVSVNMGQPIFGGQMDTSAGVSKDGDANLGLSFSKKF